MGIIRKKLHDPNCKARITAEGKLLVSGQMYTEEVQKPQVGELLQLTPLEERKFPKAALNSQMAGYKFRKALLSQVAKVTSIKEVRQVYKKFLLDPRKLSARHNCTIYRLYIPVTAKTTDGWVDDGEHGAGRLIQNYLQHKNCSKIAVLLS